MGDDPFWGPFWNLPQMHRKQREVIERARRTITEELSRLGHSNETFSLIHADLHPHNLVVGEHGLHVIDFDDAGFGWHHYELAVALYRYQEDDRFGDIRATLGDGYREVRPLPDSVVGMLPIFFLVRSLVHLGWRAQRPEHGTDLSEDIEDAVREARGGWGNNLIGSTPPQANTRRVQSDLIRSMMEVVEESSNNPSTFTVPP